MPKVDELLALESARIARFDEAKSAQEAVGKFPGRKSPVGCLEVHESGSILAYYRDGRYPSVLPKDVGQLQDWLREWFGRSPADIAEIRAALDPAIATANEGLRALVGGDSATSCSPRPRSPPGGT